MKKPNRTALVERFVELMEQFSAQMRSHLPAAWSDLELTMPQARTLMLLGHGQARMRDISAHLGCGVSSATGMIDRLVKKGLVERAEDDSDRRAVACRLTALGEEVVERFWRMGRVRFEALADVLSERELETVLPAMVVLAEATARLGQAAAGSPSPDEVKRSARVGSRG